MTRYGNWNIYFISLKKSTLSLTFLEGPKSIVGVTWHRVGLRFRIPSKLTRNNKKSRSGFSKKTLKKGFSIRFRRTGRDLRHSDWQIEAESLWGRLLKKNALNRIVLKTNQYTGQKRSEPPRKKIGLKKHLGGRIGDMRTSLKRRIEEKAHPDSIRRWWRPALAGYSPHSACQSISRGRLFLSFEYFLIFLILYCLVFGWDLSVDFNWKF